MKFIKSITNYDILFIGILINIFIAHGINGIQANALEINDERIRLLSASLHASNTTLMIVAKEVITLNESVDNIYHLRRKDLLK